MEICLTHWRRVAERVGTESEMALDLRAQKRKAETLLSLHWRGDMLVLLNVWHPIAARILEKKGYPAVFERLPITHLFLLSRPCHRRRCLGSLSQSFHVFF
jgi:hypothetical protein